jgi:adenylyltransferase/sulfurtransferase
MGLLQALEAIRILTASEAEAAPTKPKVASMLIFSAYAEPQFRTVRFKRQKRKCWTCGLNPEVTLETFKSGELDYEASCGGVLSPVNLLGTEERVEAEEYARVREKGLPHVLLDTREKTQFEICNLEGSLNVSIDDFRALAAKRKEEMDLENGEQEKWKWLREEEKRPVFVVCRFGNDSQEAVRLLKSGMGEEVGERVVMDIRGGLRAWRERVDGGFPEY